MKKTTFILTLDSFGHMEIVTKDKFTDPREFLSTLQDKVEKSLEQMQNSGGYQK